jgi:hypothetical protein
MMAGDDRDGALPLFQLRIQHRHATGSGVHFISAIVTGGSRHGAT